jgi:iron complex outermembrane recepter protein
MRTTLRQKLLASTLFIGAAAIATPAWAQPSDDDTQENPVQATPDATGGEMMQNQNDNAEEQGAIVVTGSRIQRRDLTSTSPLAVIQDEEFKLSGAVNVEQVINTLPQVIPGTTAFSNNPGGGFATLDLRGLGSTRTLVLVNGRRYVFFDTSQRVDLNTIPQFLLDSVDVVTGGASAVYGSDALSGVVNFRLQTDLQGITTGASYGITEEGDGGRFNAFIGIGSEFADGRGNVTVFGEYFKRQPIFQGDREFSRVALNDGTTGLVPGGSATTPQGRFAAPATAAIPGLNLNPCPPPPAAQPPGCDADFTDPGELAGVSINRAAGTNFAGLGANITVPGARSAPFLNPQDLYNYAPSNYLQVPQERWLLGGYGEFEITEAVTAFTEVTFVNNRVANELAPTPVTGNVNITLTGAAGTRLASFLNPADFAELQRIDAQETAINAERAARSAACATGGGTPGQIAQCQSNFNPLFGAAAAPGVVQLGVNRRITETGPRNQLDERNAFRVLGGLKGPITENFNYEAYYFYARTRNAQIQEGNISRSAFNAAVGASTINVFGPDTISAAGIDGITLLSQNQDISVLQVASASVAGTLGNFGLGASDIGIALGAEYRKVGSQFIPDTALSSGDVVGFNAGDATSGGYDVKEGFAELRLPIIADRPFFHRLELTGAFRYSDYSLAAVGGVETYAVGGEFAPIRDITFRAQYQRAVRAPNVGELFGGQSNGFPPATDPCSVASAATNATVRQLCIQTGVPAPFIGTGSSLQPNTQIEGLFGGNPNLQEETGDTYTAGVVLRPSFLPRLAITIDGYDITIEDTISTFGGGLGNTLNLCYNVVQDLSSEFCQAIILNPVTGLPARDPATGQIGGQFIPAILNANLGKFETRGIDLQVDYSQPLGFSLMGGEESRLNFFFLGTYTDKFDITPIASLPDEINECAGRFGVLACGDPIPKYKWTSRLSLIDGGSTISVRWRHIGSSRDDDPDTDYIVERLRAKDYIDLSFSYDASDALRFTVGVNNLFDVEPQLIGSNQQQANTYPSTFDVLGRDYFVSANLRF